MNQEFREQAQVRKDALEEAAKECDVFAEAYSFFRPYPKGYVYTEQESRAAMAFAQGRFKVAAKNIRALATIKQEQP
jgi:hypothetical protein